MLKAGKNDRKNAIPAASRLTAAAIFAKLYLFFDRGSVPLNGKRDERHEKFGH